MLTTESVNYLKPFVFREDAERLTCVHPLGGIYWADEIPNFKELTRIPEPDRIGIFHLFRIRFLIWNGDELSDDDKIFLEHGCVILPKDFVRHAGLVRARIRRASSGVPEVFFRQFPK
jgi:hypothetical protein